MAGEQRHPIQVVVRRTGLSADVLRAWERRYGAVVPGRSPTGRRVYSDDDIERLRLLHRATHSGRSIGQIAQLSTAELTDLVRDDELQEVEAPSVEVAPEVESDEAEYLEAALRAVEDLDTPRLEAILERATVALSAAGLLDGVLVPMLTTIGDRWLRGELTIAHEHAASAVARQVLGDLLRTAEHGSDAPTAVFGALAGDRHEFGALMAAATAAAMGWHVVYLGADVPAESLAVAAVRHRPRVVGLSMVGGSSPASQTEVATLRKALSPDVTLVVGGRGAVALAAELANAGAVVVESLAGFRAFLARAKDGSGRSRRKA